MVFTYKFAPEISSFILLNYFVNPNFVAAACEHKIY